MGVFQWVLSSWTILSGKIYHVAVRVHLTVLPFRQPFKPEWTCQLSKEMIASWIIWAIFHGQSENLNPVGGFHSKSRKRPIPCPTILELGWCSETEMLRYSELLSPGGSSEDINLFPQSSSSKYEPWYWPAANLSYRITINPSVFPQVGEARDKKGPHTQDFGTLKSWSLRW